MRASKCAAVSAKQTTRMVEEPSKRWNIVRMPGPRSFVYSWRGCLKEHLALKSQGGLEGSRFDIWTRSSAKPWERGMLNECEEESFSVNSDLVGCPFPRFCIASTRVERFRALVAEEGPFISGVKQKQEHSGRRVFGSAQLALSQKRHECGQQKAVDEMIGALRCQTVACPCKTFETLLYYSKLSLALSLARRDRPLLSHALRVYVTSALLKLYAHSHVRDTSQRREREVRNCTEMQFTGWKLEHRLGGDILVALELPFKSTIHSPVIVIQQLRGASVARLIQMEHIGRK